MINIVLCGGHGRKLWPLSQISTPKQFLKFGGEYSLYQKTIKRNLPYCEKTIAVTDQRFSDAADKQLSEIGAPYEIVMEPSGKNTGVAIAMACLLYPGRILLVTPCDHEISDEKAYAEAVARGRELAEAGHIAVFGAEGQSAEPRFGYFRTDGESITHFREKPDAETAARYLDEGYHVNSGILCFNSDVTLNELINNIPEQMLTARTVVDNKRSGRATHRLCGRFMGDMQNISIEHAVLENSDKLKFAGSFKGWNDVGTFGSFYRHKAAGRDINISLNIGDTFGCADFADSRGSMVLTTNHDVVVCGLDNIVVVEVNGKILVARKDIDVEQALKKLEE